MDTTPAAVLVIESHPLMREALCSAIAGESDLSIAEADLNQTQPRSIPILDDLLFLPQKLDIILLALGNPGQKELEALQALRRALPEIPILALTSNEVPGQEDSALEAGACAVLTKAASRGKVIDTLRELRMTLLLKRSNPRLEAENGISS